MNDFSRVQTCRNKRKSSEIDIGHKPEEGRGKQFGLVL